MYELRQVLVCMRLGDSDRALAKSGLIGRPKAKALRQLADAEGWLDPKHPLPEDAVLAEALPRAQKRSSSTSSVEPFRDKVEQWAAHDIVSNTQAPRFLRGLVTLLGDQRHGIPLEILRVISSLLSLLTSLWHFTDLTRYPYLSDQFIMHSANNK
jgi:hypothetical protein